MWGINIEDNLWGKNARVVYATLSRKGREKGLPHGCFHGTMLGILEKTNDAKLAGSADPYATTDV
jgi:hypothetical protein